MCLITLVCLTTGKYNYFYKYIVKMFYIYYVCLSVNIDITLLNHNIITIALVSTQTIIFYTHYIIFLPSYTEKKFESNVSFLLRLMAYLFLK